MWGDDACGVAWTPVEEERRRVQRLSPKRSRSCTMYEQSTNTIIYHAYSPLGLAILL